MLGFTATCTIADNVDVLVAIAAISKKFDTLKEGIEDLKRERSSRRGSERTLSPHRLWSRSPRRKSPAGSKHGSASRDSRARSRYPLPKVVATKTPSLDLFMRSKISTGAKALDKDLTKIQTFVLDSMAPLTALLERGDTMDCLAVQEAASIAMELLGNANARILRLCREKIVTAVPHFKMEGIHTLKNLRRLVSEGGPEGRLLLHSDTPRPQKVPVLPARGQNLSIYLPPLRPGFGTMGLYQDPQACGSPRMRAGDAGNILYRRRSSDGGDQGDSTRSGVRPGLPVTESGVHYKHEEDNTGPNPVASVSGLHGRLDQDGAQSTTRKKSRKSKWKLESCRGQS